ncbi:MAG: hypothetical protein GX606_03545 [Elusimicrobia bacterium]|nr:hypothetical protein [Elusimicrobiota bacterium]
MTQDTRGKTGVLLSALFAMSFLSSPVFSAPAIHGFLETAIGARLERDDTKGDDLDLAEARAQLKTSYYFEGDHFLAQKSGVLNAKGDFLLDGYYAGKTSADLRELNLSLTPASFMDMKIGRQVLTWGTGDYLFINDLFPKDYVSFFSGRDDEYLKKPSDAMRLSFFPSGMNLDAAAMIFEPNTTAKGDRLSFYDSFQGRIAGVDSDRRLVEPANTPEDLEYALRAYRTVGSHEWAAYVFRGFDKNPTSYKNELARELYYRRLDVYGASVRGPFASGIGNIEAGYQRSPEDASGGNRLIENSAIKMMAGYDKDLGQDLRLGLQYLYERRLNYADYAAALLPADLIFDEHRHVLTQRLTKLLWDQRLTLSLFNFFSLSDKDGYVRASAGYKVSDAWEVTLGLHAPWGEEDTTEFGQMKQDRSVVLRTRFSF